jgi:hypothetical protein
LSKTAIKTISDTSLGLELANVEQILQKPRTVIKNERSQKCTPLLGDTIDVDLQFSKLNFVDFL